MAYSCPPTNVGRDHVDPTIPQFIADLDSSLTIKVPIYPVTLAAVDRCRVLGDLLIALTYIRRAELMEASEVVFMQDAGETCVATPKAPRTRSFTAIQCGAEPPALPPLVPS